LLVEHRYDEAIAFCQHELTAWPRSVTLRLVLARSLLAQRQVHTAVAQLRQILQIDPSCGDARRLLAEYDQPASLMVARHSPSTAAPVSFLDEEADRPTTLWNPKSPLPPFMAASAPIAAPSAPFAAPPSLTPAPRRSRRNSFASPPEDVARPPANWQRPLGAERRRPSPLPRVGFIAVLLGAAAAIGYVSNHQSMPLPMTALVPAALPAPAPEPAVAKPELALGAGVWIHPLAGPTRRMPLRDSRLFGAERYGDRPRECRGGHCGIDLGGTYGEPVFAVHDAVIERVQRAANPDHGGHYVRLAHEGGAVVSQYFHLSTIPRWLENGGTVKTGDIVGYVGLTGVRHSGPHLHFTIEVRSASGDDARYLDPEPLVALWPLRANKDEKVRLASAPPGLARGFMRRHHRHPSAE
jgi:murein DD-endopeptidase MepM/ murein hydrolase activator NlpD